jgi:hypothetical protein
MNRGSRFAWLLPAQLKKDSVSIVNYGIQQGWVHLPQIQTKRLGRIPLAKRPSVAPAEQLEKQRLSMARLRAERKGEDTSMFPSRLRKPPQRKNKLNGIQQSRNPVPQLS